MNYNLRWLRTSTLFKKWLWLGLIIVVSIVVILALQNRAAVDFQLWPGMVVSIPLVLLLLTVVVCSVALTLLSVWQPSGVTFLSTKGPGAILPQSLRHKILNAYQTGDLGATLEIVRLAQASDPENWRLNYWHIRLLLDTGQMDVARQLLLKTLNQLPVEALNVRWSHLYQEVGEAKLWVTHVLNQVNLGLPLQQTTLLELIEVLQGMYRFQTALELVDLVRQIDPPTPQEEQAFIVLEMRLRVGFANMLLEDGQRQAGFLELAKVRSQFPKWRSSYILAATFFISHNELSAGVQTYVDGYRNTGDPDMLYQAYKLAISQHDPIEVLEQFDQQLADLSQDAWYQFTMAWIAFEHGLIEEGIARLQQLEASTKANQVVSPHVQAQFLLAKFDAGRGHYRDAAIRFAQTMPSWGKWPFFWYCRQCQEPFNHVEYQCPTCQAWESFELRPLAFS